MNPFAQMAQVLARPSVMPSPAREYSAARYNGKTDKLRAVLECGPANAKDLADVAGLGNSGLVYALLRQDIRKGQISLYDGIYRRTSF